MTKRPLCLGAAGVLSGILAAAYGWSVFARALLACGVLACGILGGIFADGYRPGDGISPAERKRTAFGAGVFLLMFALGSGRYLEAEESRQVAAPSYPSVAVCGVGCSMFVDICLNGRVSD